MEIPESIEEMELDDDLTVERRIAILEAESRSLQQSHLNFTEWPFPRMYQFLVDDFRTHLTKAEHALGVRDQATYLAEMEEARRALDDFNHLIHEFEWRE